LKKVISLAVVIIAVLLFAKFYQLKTVGILENSTYALTDNRITQSLFADDVPPEKAVIEPTKAESLTPLYEAGGNLFIGERKNKLNSAYPLFVNDATAIMTINNSVKLITEDFERVNSYYGLYVSDGISFNADKERADAETFILLELANKLYINAQQMEVHTICGDIQIPMNGIINFQEETIRYYTLEEEQFRYKEITKLDEQAWVRFADREYPYLEFLKELGKLKERDGERKPGEKEEAPPVEIIEEDDEESEVPQDEEQEERGKAPAVKPDAAAKPAKPSFQKPRVSMTEFKVNQVKKTAETTLSIHDPSGVLTGVIQVVLQDAQGNMQRWTYADYTDAQQGVIHPVAAFTGLESGMTYSAYGTYTYWKANGQKETELFGFKTFYVEEQLIYFFDLPKEEPKPELPYVKPQISCAPFVASIYDLKSTLTIQEPGSMVAGGIRFEVYRDDRLIMRKTVSESGEFTIGPLPPDTEYQKRFSS